MGDGFASIVGKKWGRRVYRVWRHPKTLEGSLAMGLAFWVAVAGVLFTMTGLPIPAIMLRALVIASLATMIEGLSPWGLDNLTVPLGSGIVYWLFYFNP